MGRYQREKGRRFEVWCRNWFASRGAKVRKVGMQQQDGTTEGDLVVDDLGVVECKVGQQVPKKIYDWLDKADALVVKCDRRKPLIVMELDRWDECSCLFVG